MKQQNLSATPPPPFILPLLPPSTHHFLLPFLKRCLLASFPHSILTPFAIFLTQQLERSLFKKKKKCYSLEIQVISLLYSKPSMAFLSQSALLRITCKSYIAWSFLFLPPPFPALPVTAQLAHSSKPLHLLLHAWDAPPPDVHVAPHSSLGS